ncbi:trophoblast glycoprotein-like isoform X2 [Electrophorus electricus]|uniref:trophoblast glycoprotein-like isoform X2 n=1 Tax=Electrophorus electricus TaxID=8005 RepID=UPI0015D00958|nr:trophoblast glycoprotein-like isoform X2 [Electrophorus electricus]
MPRLPLLFCALLYASPCHAECLPGCECLEASQTVRCVYAGLREVPGDIPKFTKILFITGNRIHRVSYNSFHGVENVTKLVLSNNGIKELGSHAFSLLLTLCTLNLSQNQLALIHPEAFSVPGSPLQELSLSGSLYNSTSVTDLITALRWGALRNLLHLDLSGNHLVLLPPATFSPLPSLRQLILANNSLVAIYTNTFSGLEQLQELDLRYNMFRTLSSEGLREIEILGRATLLLGQNPYSCSCDVQEFARWLNSSRVQVGDVERLLCASPPSLQGRVVTAISIHTSSCYGKMNPEEVVTTLQTSYVFLGLVLGLVGMIFLFVLYLNRHGIRKWITEMHAACRDVLEGYHYRYEIDSDPRARHYPEFGTNDCNGSSEDI